MAGMAIVLDLLRKNPSLSGQTLHSYGLFSATLAASTAAASVAAGTPFASRALFGNVGISVAHCDAGASISEDYISSIRNACGNIFQHDSLNYSTKEYKIELKPLFSAFGLKSFALTSLRSFLLFYLPLLESRADLEEDDDNFLQDTPEENHVDLVVPLKKSVKQIIRESTVVTTRRVLERLAVHYVSQRMAWKLLKDVPKSAIRKAERGMPTSVYFFCVSRTTFRGHFLGVAASWLVQVGIDIYRFFSSIFNPNEETDKVDKAEQVQLLAKKVYGTTVRCSASLVFASIGAGIGATLFRPSAGQWIGCALGDLAGPIVVSFCFEKVLHVDL
uniref:Isopentenyl-diphosphate delta-isomerase n=1 Tax=Davidia involucrata TaxID=16924 RepID=A0A5B7AQU8_DAVIN